MQQTAWNKKVLEQFQAKFAREFLRDSEVLQSYQRDFGGLVQSQTLAVFKPATRDSLSAFLQDINAQHLPISLRCFGLSQSGQSLPAGRGVTLDVSALPKTLQWENDTTIRASNSLSFGEICRETLSRGKLLRAFPYNMHLSVGGVLSVGGLGASTFREGIIAAHVLTLTVMTVDGQVHHCSPNAESALFEAVLSGVGQFGVILDAGFALRPAKAYATIHSVAFSDVSTWLACNRLLVDKADYLEAVWVEPLAKSGQPAFCTRFALEHRESLDALPETIITLLQEYQAQLMGRETLTTEAYLFRHDGRFQAMRDSGQWEQQHPWFECYLAEEDLLALWPQLQAELGKGLVGENLHVFPVARMKNRFFMLPAGENIVTFNLLMPGIGKEAMPKALESLARLESILERAASKRYISGYLAQHEDQAFWQTHYGEDYVGHCRLKEQYDPKHLLQSAFLS